MRQAFVRHGPRTLRCGCRRDKLTCPHRARVGGPSLFVDTASGVKVSDAKVVIADVIVTNGAIHVIDKVPLPQ
ncbi:MAG TPA: fasciclin domain-containing protein [Polyangiales bacterium]